jgi:hypothetical protein
MWPDVAGREESVMRKMALAISLALSLPAAAVAQVDAGMPDENPNPVADGEQGGHTGNSFDPNGNMGNVGRTGKPVPWDAGADALENKGAEGSSGANHPDEDHEPRPPADGDGTPTP